MNPVNNPGVVCCAFMSTPKRPTAQKRPVTYPTTYQPYRPATVRDDTHPMPWWRLVLKGIAYALCFTLCWASWLAVLILAPGG